MNVTQLTPQSNRATRKMNSAVRERMLCCIAQIVINLRCLLLRLVSSFLNSRLFVMKTVTASAALFSSAKQVSHYTYLLYLLIDIVNRQSFLAP
jgi:hypothetical protein